MEASKSGAIPAQSAKQLVTDWIANYVAPIYVVGDNIDATSLRNGLLLSAIIAKTDPSLIDFEVRKVIVFLVAIELSWTWRGDAFCF
tara:strand:+ start:1274 stop:1534 length:261 start_codon:yes stop_codon:yes gene_type:complete